MKIGVIQMNSKLDPAPNLEFIKLKVEEGKRQGVETFFLPECFYSMSDGLAPTPYLVDGEDEHFKAIQNIAENSEVALLAGSAATLLGGKVINRNYNFSKAGTELNHYDKIHLFNCALKDKKINESDIYTPGNLPQLLEYEGLKIGLGICFDVRFSKMAHDYRMLGANVLTYSSAFTIPTGKAHWHTLLRARAIENQCYVIAPAQWGRHNDRIQTFGHSLVVDPWGEVLVDGGEGEMLLITEIDLNLVADVRQRILM